MTEFKPGIIYYVNGEQVGGDEFPGGLYPQIGAGIVWDDGKRYRVEDTWFVHEKHGAMARGALHVFLLPVNNSDDRPGKMHPRYFGYKSAGRVW
ncbi:hypothetical protein CFN78_06835 [Amycolatopsis antarctica]|uniref:Uncharacterized protein n=1 Tax=Amycolatopsis antarctica TaxID=1854586 RepID=A0A263D7J9_9PSEU|nr:hypothetical protein [Amycolatopsis antarctica]OZM73998.1 hypothetical protein CFN78_06835 [Amycolatopsis antarctica]